MPIRTDYEVVGYRPAFRRQMHALQTYLWGHDLDAAVWADYLDWKYSRNPYVDTTLIYVAMHADEVVGMRGLYGAKWLVGQPTEELVSLCAGDLIIAPEHRNRGVFSTLTRAALNDAAERGYAYLFNFNPGLITSLGFAALGWRALGSVEPVSWESRYRAIVRRASDGATWGRGLARGVWQYAKRLPVAREVGHSVKQRFAVWAQMGRQSFARLDAHGVAQTTSRRDRISVATAAEPEAMAELVERVGSDGRIRHVRDREFFGWRFCNPLSRYRFLFWKEAGRLDGYLVLQTSILPGRAGINIVDWEASRMEVGAQLLRAAIECARFGDLTVWSATASDETRALLRDAGFSQTARAVGIAAARHRILVRPVRDDMLEREWVVGGRRLLDLADWDLRMIDSDAH